MKYHLIMLSAGLSRRFGSNKLLYEINGERLYAITLNKLIDLSQRDDVQSLIVVTRYREIIEDLEKRNIPYIINDHSEDGIASSLVLGIQGTLRLEKVDHNDREAFVFFVSDQPGLKIETINSMLDHYEKSDKGILCACSEGHRGNPVIFSEKYKNELLALTGDCGGKQIIARYMDDLGLYEVSPEEITDIDRPEGEHER